MGHSELPAAEAATPVAAQPAPKRRNWVSHIAALLAAVGITLGLILLRDQIKHLPVVGYPAVFLISLIGNATIILPTPSMAVVLGVSGALNPVAVGVIAGLGSALGEMTGYLAGVGGRAVIEDRDLYNRIEGWMRQRGLLVIFVLGLIPNPVFDVGGMIAGALKMPFWQFLLAAWAGKGLRLVIFALGGQLLFSTFLDKIL
jgi:membrane protein YqaA with SNARE-associated domain